MSEILFHCLGSMEIIRGQQVLPSGGPHQRGLLAMLLLNANRPVSADQLIAALWARPPNSAAGQIQTRIWKLRRLLQTPATIPQPSTTRPQLVTTAGAYCLIVDPDTVDLLVFERMVNSAHSFLAADRPREALTELRGALALFRGPAFSNVAAPGVAVEAAAIEERRLAAIDQRMEIELAFGRHLDVIAELRELVAAHPYQERLRYYLMRALHRSGRRAEAVAAYREGHRAMVDGAGLEPSRELQELHREILASDAAVKALSPPDSGGAWAPKSHDLPRDAVRLVGRCVETTRLLEFFRRPGDTPAPRVAMISGPPGVGKTALAVRIAHMLADEVPDGQLFAWLGGETDPRAILHRFLRTLGITESEMPGSLEERSALYRACMVDRRAVLLIDDAHSEAQVRPLLPGSQDALTIITGRRSLTALESVHHLDLAPLSDGDTVRLLADIIGQQRVDAEPVLAERIARRCEGLPLAVRAVGARLRGRAHWSLARLAQIVDDDSRRLDAFRFGDLDVRAALGSGYTRLTRPARRLFIQLGELDHAEFCPDMAARLVGVPAIEVVDLAEELVEAGLIASASGPGREGAPAGCLRYRISEVGRLFAREQADPDRDIQARGNEERIERKGTAHPTNVCLSWNHR
jgi:DNA-binding SARP family transcriptional activator